MYLRGVTFSGFRCLHTPTHKRRSRLRVRDQRRPDKPDRHQREAGDEQHDVRDERRWTVCEQARLARRRGGPRSGFAVHGCHRSVAMAYVQADQDRLGFPVDALVVKAQVGGIRAFLGDSGSLREPLNHESASGPAPPTKQTRHPVRRFAILLLSDLSV